MTAQNSIVVLDGFTLNPGDLSWDSLHALGNCTLYDRTALGDVIERAQHAEIVLTNKVVLSKEIIAQLPKLRYIGVLATGYNVVDIAAAKERGIIVTNVPAYSTHSVAQTVFALLLELTHRTGHHSIEVRKGRWSSNPDFSFTDFPLTELHGSTFGIIGFGNIGRSVAKIASAFGMNVLVSSRTTYTSQVLKTWEVSSDIAFTDTESLLRRSDIVSLHCALNEQTRLLINKERLQLMKPSALLINTGRGPLVDEQALADALNQDRLAGAGLDVLSSEPPSPDNPLLSAKNCIITPHIAWASFAARTRLMDAVVNNIRSFINGTPVNVVS
ncbi:MAG: D-2-hydroxyacid dehydrogenase [Bacteroidetes bacterium]|nr:D-2-hydroxyacid dehydrogenase [Bacteroidota bacterium]